MKQRIKLSRKELRVRLINMDCNYKKLEEVLGMAQYQVNYALTNGFEYDIDNPDDCDVHLICDLFDCSVEDLL